MKGLLTKDFLTVKKKYGLARLIMDLAIIATLMIILKTKIWKMRKMQKMRSL